MNFRGYVAPQWKIDLIDEVCIHMSRYNIKSIVNHIVPLLITTLKQSIVESPAEDKQKKDEEVEMIVT